MAMAFTGSVFFFGLRESLMPRLARTARPWATLLCRDSRRDEVHPMGRRCGMKIRRIGGRG